MLVPGNPAAGGLPEWPAYSAARRATMILNRDCSIVDDPYGGERIAFEGVSLREVRT